MARAPLVRIALPALLLLCGGCEFMIKPTAQMRDASYPKLAAEFHGDWDRLDHAVSFVFANDSPFEIRITGTGANTRFEIPPTTHAGKGGLATAISRDGYLLTVAHVTGPCVRVLAFIDGKPVALPARIVKAEYYGVGEEFALLKIEASTDAWVEYQPAPSPATIFAVGLRWQEGRYLTQLAGHVLGSHSTPGENVGRRFTTDLPIWHGDSGGPVFSPAGTLLGVTTAFEVHNEYLRIVRQRFFWSPSPTLIADLIARDRASHAVPVAP